MVVSRSVDILKIRYMFRDVRYVRQKFVLSSILFYLSIYIDAERGQPVQQTRYVRPIFASPFKPSRCIKA